MKNIIHTTTLHKLFVSFFLATWLIIFSLFASCSPAHAADKYIIDLSITPDLSFRLSHMEGTKEELARRFNTENSTEICKKLTTESSKEVGDLVKKDQLKVTPIEIGDCSVEDNYFFIAYSGKITAESLGFMDLIDNTFIVDDQISAFVDSRGLRMPEGVAGDDIGTMRFKLPGEIKNVTPDVGKVSGNTWTLENPLTETQIHQNHIVIIKATRGTPVTNSGSNLGLILGITIPAALIIVAVIVLLIVRSKRKKKQQNLPAYPAGSRTYPPPPFMPGNSAYPVQSPVPGYPAAPGAPGMPGGAQSPISSAPAQGGYPPGYGYFPAPPTNPGSPGQTSTPGYPPLGAPGTPGAASYPYPYPPANPQNPNGGYYPASNQGYGTPTPGFPTPATPPQPAAGQQGNPEDRNQATPAEQPGQKQ